MGNETPNERNYRLLRERFLKEDQIVYSDGKGNEYTLPELKQIAIKKYEYGYGHRILVGNESALHMISSFHNLLRDEMGDVIWDLEKEVMADTFRTGMANGYQLRLVNYPNENYCELYFGNETIEYRIFENEKMKLVVDEFKYPIEIRFENGHRIMFGNEPLSENRICIKNENGIRYENGNETRNGNENETGNGNGLLDMLRYSYNQIKKLL